MKEKIIGVLGGMGPYATLTFFKSLLDLTPAKKDWNYPRIIIDSNSKIPSRSRAVWLGEASPVPMMREALQNLENAGVDFIVIPCNTAHYFFDEVKDAVKIPVLNILEETVDYVISSDLSIKKIGVLGSDVTVKKGLFNKYFNEKGIEVIVPDDEDQKKSVEVIESVKIGDSSDKVREKIKKVANHLIEKGAKGLVLGCTEFAELLNEDLVNVPLFDSSIILAKSALKRAGIEYKA